MYLIHSSVLINADGASGMSLGESVTASKSARRIKYDLSVLFPGC